MARDYANEVSELSATLSSVEQVLNLPKLRKEFEELEKEASAPNLWDDPAKAQAVTSKLSRVQATINKVMSIRRKLEDVPLLLELATAENDQGAQADAVKELDEVTKLIRDLEVQTLLSGEYDDRDCLVTIRSEAGGVEAADWAQMLMRMYLMWAEKNGFTITELDRQDGDVAGVKSVSLEIKGDFAFGYLKGENGVHRMVRISPFDSNARRHTSFVSVYVYPLVDDTIEIEIKPQDIELHTSRSGGAGGQNVNKVETMAEALWHVASSRFFADEEKALVQEKLANKINKEGYLSVKSSATRSQLENKQIAQTKIQELVAKSLVKPKKRKATKPSKEAKEKRLESKKKEGVKKEMRRRPGLDI